MHLINAELTQLLTLGISSPSKHFWHFKVDMWDPNSSGDLHLQSKSWYISHRMSFLYKSNPQSIQCVFLAYFDPNKYLWQNVILSFKLPYVLIHIRPSPKCLYCDFWADFGPKIAVISHKANISGKFWQIAVMKFTLMKFAWGKDPF